MYGERDPDSVLDWAWDWSAWLAEGEQITEATVIADDGLTVSDPIRDGAVVTVWVSGGEAGQTYRMTCRVTTSQGRIDDRSIWLTTRER